MSGRPIEAVVLSVLACIAGIASLVVTLQFLRVIPWGHEALDFWGGRWAGVVIFGVATVISFTVAYGWLTLKPWAMTITLLAALLGISTPLMAYFAGTETFSTALGPVIANAVIIGIALRPSVRQAIRAEASKPYLQPQIAGHQVVSKRPTTARSYSELDR
jgi:hypothetical protein